MTRKGKELTDEGLDIDDKNQRHRRKQKLFESLTNIGVGAIYVVPIILAIFYVAILLHKAFLGNWDGLEADIKYMIVPVVAYLVGVMSKSGLLPQ